jgi:hypothetical protein
MTLYQLRPDAIRKRAEITASALTAQLATLVQIQAMPNDRKQSTWDAIASAPGGPGQGSSIERAIAIQIQYLDRIANGKKITNIPTYGLRNT